jgi:hypothetical protein
MTSRNIAFLSALLLVAVLCGCARTNDPLSSDPNTALRQAHELLPMGTSETGAEEILKRNGLKVSRPHSERNDLFIGTYTRERKTWEICATIMNGQVFVFSVNIIDASP